MKKKMEKLNKKFGLLDKSGFTLIELLLIMLIIGILVAVIFVTIGNQRKKAKLNAVMQTAKGSHAIARECYFRTGSVNTPNQPESPDNEICSGSRTEWMPITVDECEYDTSLPATRDEYYEIICDDLDKKIRCGIRSDGECEELDYP